MKIAQDVTRKELIKTVVLINFVLVILAILVKVI